MSLVPKKERRRENETQKKSISMRHQTPSVPQSLLVPLRTISTKPKQPWDRDIALTQICRNATYHTLKPLEPEILACCEACLQHNFMSKENQSRLETGLLRALNIIATLDRTSSDEVVAPPPPQRRHIPPPRMPDKPTMPAVPKARLSAADEAKGRDLLAKIAAMRDRYMKEKLEHDAMERDLEDDLALAEDKRRTLQKHFEKVNHEVAVARSGLDTVKDAQLIEIRNYISPPDMVRKVLEAVLMVLNEPRATEWPTMQHYLKQPDFIPSVRAVSDINGLSAESLQRIRKITMDPSFTTENARRASHACAPLVQWTHAMMHYYDIGMNAKGLKEELERLDAEIAARQNELANGGRKLKLLNQEIRAQQLEYDEKYGPTAVAKLNDKARLEATVVFRAAVADWRAQCNMLKEKHRLQLAALSPRALSPPKPPRPLLTRTVQTVEETRARCQRLVDAIQATMEQLKGPHGNVIVVEKRLYPKPAPRPVTSATARSFVESARNIGKDVKPAEELDKQKRARTPHLAPWRDGAKYKFERNARVAIEVKKPEEPPVAAAAASSSSTTDPTNTNNNDASQQQQQQQQYYYQDPNQGMQQQHQQYDPYGQQQQQQWGQPQAAAYEPYGVGGGQASYAMSQQQAYDPYGGYSQGGGGYAAQQPAAGGFTFM